MAPSTLPVRNVTLGDGSQNHAQRELSHFVFRGVTFRYGMCVRVCVCVQNSAFLGISKAIRLWESVRNHEPCRI